jgi:putative transposase
VAGLICKMEISRQTFYRWRKRHAGLEVDQVGELRQLQEENARLTELMADLTSDRTMFRAYCQKSSKALVPYCAFTEYNSLMRKR